MPVQYKLYAHPVAQPSRAVLWFCALAQIKHELIVTMVGVDTEKPEFITKFPLASIPALEVLEEGKAPVYISDAAAIVAYFAAANVGTARELYPEEPVARAKTVLGICLAQTTHRTVTTTVFRPLFMAFKFKTVCNLSYDDVSKYLVQFESNIVDLSRAAGWTTPAFDGTRDPVVENPANVFFVAEAGANKLTAADLFLFAEIYQLEVLGLLGEIKERRPAFARWMAAMSKVPVYAEMHATVDGFVNTELKKLMPAKP